MRPHSASARGGSSAAHGKRSVISVALELHSSPMGDIEAKVTSQFISIAKLKAITFYDWTSNRSPKFHEKSQKKRASSIEMPFRKNIHLVH